MVEVCVPNPTHGKHDGGAWINGHGSNLVPQRQISFVGNADIRERTARAARALYALSARVHEEIAAYKHTFLPIIEDGNVQSSLRAFYMVVMKLS